MATQKKILILAANPKDTARLRLDEEVREIKEGLRLAKKRELFEIEQREAVRIRDLRRALLDCEPQILHFSGHGEVDGIVLEDETGKAIVVEPEALAGLFKLFDKQVECVLLNACYSEAQASAINQHIKYVIGMVKEISDRAAIEFAVGYYDALGAGKSYEDAFQFGSNAIQLKCLPENLTPLLKVNPDLSLHTPAIRIFFCYKSMVEPDKTIAHEVARALKEKGYYVFIDKDLPVGLDWWRQIDEELKDADFFISFLSENAVKSEMVKGEIRKAFTLNKEKGRPIILPVRLQYRAAFQYPINVYLNHINWTHWDKPEDTSILIEQLDKAITGIPLPTIEEKEVEASPEKKESEIDIPAYAADPSGLKMPEGVVELESKYYIERQSDKIALNAIEKVGATIVIKGPRHMGKTSLLNRIILAAKKLNKQVACLDFQLFDKQVLTDATTFYSQFCTWLANELGVENKVDEYWHMNLSNNLRCTQYLDRHLLEIVDVPLVLAMDELETIFYSDFRSDFLSMLRSWHNQRKLDSCWKNVDLVLVTATEPYLFIDDLQQSPFNIGEVIELKDFSAEQVSDLNLRHGSPFNPEQEKRLMQLLHGHPFLVRQAMYFVASGIFTAEELFDKAIDDDGPFADHLRYRFYKIHDQEDLIQGIKKIIKNQTCHDDLILFRLQCFGLTIRKKSKVVFRCDMYRRYFEKLLYD